jgi:hypothetical protein
MFVGHLATGVVLKALSPRTPTMPIMMGVCWMDILDGLFAVIGIDQVIPNPETGPYIFFDLTFVDWDHSLLMALVLSALWGSLFLKEGKTALLASLAVFSHFLTDIPVHNNDLALYPHSAAHLGYGLWESLGTSAWALEGVFSAALLAFSWWRMRSIGVDLIGPIAVLTVAFLMVSPWLSPMKLVIQTPEPWPHLLYGTLTGGSFLLLGVLLTSLINRAERSSAPLMTR